MPVPLPYPGIFQHSVLRFGDLTEEQSPSYHGMPWNEQTLVYAYASHSMCGLLPGGNRTDRQLST